MKRKSFLWGLASFIIIIFGIFFLSQETITTKPKISTLKKVVMSADYPKIR